MSMSAVSNISLRQLAKVLGVSQPFSSQIRRESVRFLRLLARGWRPLVLITCLSIRVLRWRG